MFRDVEKIYVEEFISIYSGFIQNPNSKKIKEEAEGLGIRSNPALFSEEINEAAMGCYKIEFGEMTVEEAKRILNGLIKLKSRLENKKDDLGDNNKI